MIMKVMSVAPSIAPAAEQHFARADPEDQHRDRRADRSRSSAARATAMRVMRTMPASSGGSPRVKRCVLVRLAAERLHEPHAAHDFLQHARDLAVVAAQAAMSLAQLAQHRLQREREQRRDDERDEA